MHNVAEITMLLPVSMMFLIITSYMVSLRFEGLPTQREIPVDEWDWNMQVVHKDCIAKCSQHTAVKVGGISSKRAVRNVNE